MQLKAKLLDEQAMLRALRRISHEIVEHQAGTNGLVLVGVKRRGVPLAEKLASMIMQIDDTNTIPVGSLDIAFYRDDLSKQDSQPLVKSTDIQFDIEGKTVVLVDDVIYTGRTIRAALDALMDIGRAQRIQLAVLIDRGHRELPIRPDYVGKNVPTSRDEMIAVNVTEYDGENSVLLYQQ